MPKLNLRELKGAPLSIILAIVMAGNRNCSVSYLCTETGYSDKTVASGLALLRGRQIVTETRRNCYQLTGENVQLPLYWGEKTEPADPSPALLQAELPGMEAAPENFFGPISHSGKIPESENIPEMEKRIRSLEMRVSGLENRINAEISPVYGEIPAKNGENSDLTLIKTTTTTGNKDTFTDLPVLPAAEKIPEKFETTEEYEKMIGELQDYYCQRDHFGCFIYQDYKPIGKEHSEMIAALHPDKRVLEYILPRAADVETMVTWCKMDHRSAKQKLLEIIGIFGRYKSEILADDSITLTAIDYHYWKWKDELNEHPEYKISIVGYRIAHKFDLLNADNSDPLRFNWLE